jgi:hypothetical protein
LSKDGILNVPEQTRRATRLEEAKKRAVSQNAQLPRLPVIVQQITQHSVKLIRLIAT